MRCHNGLVGALEIRINREADVRIHEQVAAQLVLHIGSELRAVGFGIGSSKSRAQKTSATSASFSTGPVRPGRHCKPTDNPRLGERPWATVVRGSGRAMTGRPAAGPIAAGLPYSRNPRLVTRNPNSKSFQRCSRAGIISIAISLSVSQGRLPCFTACSSRWRPGVS